MSDLRYGIVLDGIEEAMRCIICQNPMHTDRGCDGNCQYNEAMYKRIMQELDSRIKRLSYDQPEPHEIGYDDCANALLKMWMDNVLTDGNYYRIADKLNKKWGKTELLEPYTEPYKGVTT